MTTFDFREDLPVADIRIGKASHLRIYGFADITPQLVGIARRAAAACAASHRGASRRRSRRPDRCNPESEGITRMTTGGRSNVWWAPLPDRRPRNKNFCGGFGSFFLWSQDVTRGRR